MTSARNGADDRSMTSETSLNLVIVDANRTLRKGTELLLRSWGHHVVGAADDGLGGRRLVDARKPHVAVVDLDLPGGAESVLYATAELDTPVVLLLGRPDRRQLDEALACGARGLVLKEGNPDELRQAVSAVARGERYVGPSVAGLVARHRFDHGRPLSKREREILQLLAHGMTGARAANHLTVSPETVRTHVRNAMTKLGAHTRVHAVTMAVAQREIQA